jgi:hypothetical protein
MMDGHWLGALPVPFSVTDIKYRVGQAVVICGLAGAASSADEDSGGASEGSESEGDEYEPSD